MSLAGASKANGAARDRWTQDDPVRGARGDAELAVAVERVR